MTNEQLKRADEIRLWLKLLNEQRSLFNPDNYCCHLQMQDHYGNKWRILQLYAQSYDLTNAIGKEIDLDIRNDFKLYLTKIHNKLSERMIELQKELDNL